MAGVSFKIDFHTHSVASPDGGITPQQYFKALDSGKLNALAVTDHNTITMASKLASVRPKQIIIGEEIAAREGEIIGLFLTQTIPAGLSALETVQLIKDQNGIIIIPHPLERWRSALDMATIEQLADYIDAVELYNGRGLGNVSSELKAWCETKGIPVIAGSDAHSKHDLGTTFTLMDGVPEANTFRRLAIESQTVIKRASLRGRIAPKLNRLRRPKAD